MINTFHYDDSFNLLLSRESIKIVWSKAHVYILNLAAMVFMEMFIGGFLLLVHCNEMNQEHKDDTEQEIIETHRYMLMRVAMIIGAFIFMAIV